MPYATQADMVEEYGTAEVVGLTDRDNQGEINATVLDAALDKASTIIDAYLVGRYTLPLATQFPVLTIYCCDIARYRLSGAEVTEVEAVRNRYKDAIRALEAMRDGRIRLGADAAGAVASAPARVSASSGERTFTDSTLRDFVKGGSC